MNAILINTVGDLKYWKKSYDMIYFGNEFCERLAPVDLKTAVAFASKNNIDFVYVTPHVSSSGIHIVEKNLEYLNKIDNNSEVVVNDFGVLYLINKKYPQFRITWGRLFSSHLSGDLKAKSEWHIERFEFDTLESIKDSKHEKKSFYYPYTYVCTTRFCPVIGCMDSRTPDEKNNINMDSVLEDYYGEVSKMVTSSGQVIDLTAVFDEHHASLFIDTNHVSEKGNLIIAEEILKSITGFMNTTPIESEETMKSDDFEIII